MKLNGPLLALVLLSGGCATAARPASSDPLIGAWLIDGIDGQSVANGAEATVSFAEIGQVSGNAGCNRIIGAYSVSQGTLVVTPLGLTRRLCPEPARTFEAQVVARLQAANKVTTEGSGALTLSGPAGQLLIRRRGDARRQDAPKVTPGAATAAPAAAAAESVSASATPPPSTSEYGLAGGPAAGTEPAATAAATPVPALYPQPAPTVTPVAAVAPPPPVSAPATPVTPAATAPLAKVSADGVVEGADAAGLPAHATLRVQLRATPRAGGRITVLAQSDQVVSGAPPFPFHLEAPAALVPAGSLLGIVSQISADGRVLFISGADTPAPAGGGKVTVRVVSVAPVAPTPPVTVAPPPAPAVAAPPPKAIGTLPAPSVAAATSTEPASGKAPGKAYVCGGDRISVTMQGQGLELSIAGAPTATLPRIDVSTDPSTPRMFSNGVVTLIEDADGARLRFARGRAPLTTCSAG